MPTSILDEHLRGKRLREKVTGKRKALGITQKEAAYYLGISQPTYGRKEREADFNFTELTMLFDLLKFTDEEIAWIFKRRVKR